MSQFDLSKIAPAQNKHIVGTNEYNWLTSTKKYRPSFITVTAEEEIALINEFAGKGINTYNRRGEWRNAEIILSNTKKIGVVVNIINGIEQDTAVFKIHYSNKGNHIVPDYESKRRNIYNNGNT